MFLNLLKFLISVNYSGSFYTSSNLVCQYIIGCIHFNVISYSLKHKSVSLPVLSILSGPNSCQPCNMLEDPTISPCHSRVDTYIPFSFLTNFCWYKGYCNFYTSLKYICKIRETK